MKKKHTNRKRSIDSLHCVSNNCSLLLIQLLSVHVDDVNTSYHSHFISETSVLMEDDDKMEPKEAAVAPTGVNSPDGDGRDMAASEREPILKVDPAPLRPRLFALVGIFVLPIVYSGICIMVYNLTKISDKVCAIDDCLHAANYVSTSMSWKVSPCQDFYKFSCDGWKKGFVKDVDASTSLMTLPEFFNDTGVDSDNFRKATQALESCTDSFKRQDNSIQDIRKFVNEQLNLSWPNVSTTITTQNIYSVVVVLQLFYDIHPFFVLSFTSGLGEMQISTADKYHPWYRRYSSTATKPFRESLIRGVLAKMNLTATNTVVQNIIRIEDIVDTISSQNGEAVLGGINVFSQEKLKYSWNLFNAIRNHLPEKQQQRLVSKTLIRVPSLEALNETLTIMNTKPEEIANYVGWVVVETLGRRTSPALRMAMESVSETFGMKDISDHIFRQDVCYYESYRLFALVLDRNMYLRFDRSEFEFFNGIFATLKEFVKAVLEDFYWMDEETVRRVRRSLRFFVSEVGVLTRFRYKHVEGAYDLLPDVDSTEPFTKLYLQIHRDLNQLLLDKSYHYVYPRSVWAAIPKVRYIKSFEVLFLPLSLLMKPLFGLEPFSLALVYGHIVSQLSWTIFAEGYQNHAYRGQNSWTYVTERQFRIYMDCFSSGFHNKTLVLDEPALAFFRSRALTKAFQLFTVSAFLRGGDYSLSKVNLTTSQLFFVGACLDFCTRSEEREDKEAAMCNLPMRRVKAFSRVFSCGPTDSLSQLRLQCSQFRVIDKLFYFKLDDVIETSLSMKRIM